MQWKPNKYIALALGLLMQFVAMLYVARYKWALFYGGVSLTVPAVEMYLSAPWTRVASFSVVIAIVCAIHAYRIAADSDAVTSRPVYSKWFGMLGTYVVLLAATFLFRSFLYEPFRMPSGSMMPTIRVGSYLLVSKSGYGNYGSFGLTLTRTEMTSSVQRGDVVVFTSSDDDKVMYVKRVIGLPGDRIAFHDDALEINGKPVERDYMGVQEFRLDDRGYTFQVWQERQLETSYLTANIDGAPRNDFSVIVPEKAYFVMGDNRNNSRDSRHFGYIPEGSITGKVVLVSR